MDPDDTKGCAFTIQVLGRMYNLRTDSRASCKDWVITLNRIKEAHLQQGRVKLVSQPVDLLDRQTEDYVMPRVVVVANRERTRAVDESIEWDNGRAKVPDPSPNYGYDGGRSQSSLGNAVLARWSKRKSSMTKLRAKLGKWARSLQKFSNSCTKMGEDAVHLDRHVHPPGHDDQPRPVVTITKDDIEVRSPTNESSLLGNNKPVSIAKNSRSYSTGSEDIRVIS
jgi:hypothetical protein